MYCSLGDNQSSVLYYIARRSWPIATPQAVMAIGNVKQCGWELLWRFECDDLGKTEM